MLLSNFILIQKFNEKTIEVAALEYWNLENILRYPSKNIIILL